MENARRSFLKQLALTTAAAVAVGKLKPNRVEAAERKQPSVGGEILYRETPAFKDYYRSLKS